MVNQKQSSWESMLARKKEEKEKEEKPPENETSLLILNSAPKESKRIRIISLYGDINEEKSEEAVLGMMALKEAGADPVFKDPDDPTSEIINMTYEPFQAYISTWGGSAADMFAIYDTMRMIREDCEIHTIGMGKVMSAGALLLSAGTKGKRSIGKNCRVMLHSVIGGNHGPISKLENEMEEIRWTQAQHIHALVEETDMTKRYITKLLDRKVNAYLSAKEAVELGIADIII